MDLKHLQALVGIADTGSFSAAAEMIGTVQSNVSAHIARLEKELDATLVDRSTGRLTEEGAVVVARARRMLLELEALIADVGAMRHEIAGTVRLGTIGVAGRWIVPKLFSFLRERHPGVHMTVVDGTSTTLGPRLISGQIDLAVVTLPVPSEELSSSPLYEEDLVLVVTRDHPFAQGDPTEPLPLAELAQLELLLPLPGTALRDEIDAAVRPAGVTLRPAMELDGLRLIASLTFDGHGPSILPATAVPPDIRSRFCLRALEGAPRRRVGVALRSRGMPSAPTREVIELLYEIVQESSQLPDGVRPTIVSRREHRTGRSSR